MGKQSLATVKGKKLTDEERARKEAILAQYSQVSDGEAYPFNRIFFLIMLWMDNETWMNFISRPVIACLFSPLRSWVVHVKQPLEPPYLSVNTKSSYVVSFWSFRYLSTDLRRVSPGQSCFLLPSAVQQRAIFGGVFGYIHAHMPQPSLSSFF